MRLDPELASVVAALNPIGTESRLDLETIRVMRDSMAMRAALGVEPASDERVQVENVEVPGRRGGPPVVVRLYRPAGHHGGAVLYLHGGAYVLGDVYTEDERCLQLAVDSGVLVASVGYALAPEDPYPAGLEDAYAALSWLVSEAESLDVDPDRVAVGGSSAGAGLAAALTLAARERGGPTVSFQLLMYPMLDDRMDTASMAITGAPLLTGRAVADGWAHYLGAGTIDHLAAAARAQDLSGLPPAYLMVAEFDPLRDQGIDYARRLVESGVPCELHLIPGAFHGFDLVGAHTKVGRRALEEQAGVLRRALSPG